MFADRDIGKHFLIQILKTFIYKELELRERRCLERVLNIVYDWVLLCPLEYLINIARINNYPIP